MFKVDPETNHIWLTRGDYACADLGITRGEEGPAYIPDPSDKIAFYLKSAKMKPGDTAYLDPRPLISKRIPVSTMLLEILPGDTKKLPFGPYKYDVEITCDGKPDTIINNADFDLVPEVD